MDSMPSASLLAKPGFVASRSLGAEFKVTCFPSAQRLREMQSGIFAFFHMPSVENKPCHGFTWKLPTLAHTVGQSRLSFPARKATVEPRGKKHRSGSRLLPPLLLWGGSGADEPQASAGTQKAATDKVQGRCGPPVLTQCPTPEPLRPRVAHRPPRGAP